MKKVKDILEFMEINIEEDAGKDYILFCPTHIHGKESSKPHLWVNKETGVCHCFACGYKSNIKDFVRAFYKDISDAEVEDIVEDGRESDLLSPINIEIVDIEEVKKEKPVFDFTPHWTNPDYSYLMGRGISERVLKKFQIGHNKQFNSVVIPLKDINSEFIGYKERSIKSKKFYNSTGLDLSKFIFGAFLIRELNLTKITLVESEIDAMYLWSNNIPAIAIMGKNFTEEKANLIASLGIMYVEIFTDFDEAGVIAAQDILKLMKGKVLGIYRTQQTDPNVKDANDMTPLQLKNRKIVKVY